MIPILELNKTGYYQIDQSGLITWPFEITRGTGYKFTVSHTSWATNQTGVVKFWVSKSPGGISVSGWPVGTWRNVTATRMGQSFVIYDSLQSGWSFADVVFAWPVVRDFTYYLNVQNKENKMNGFSLSIEQLFRDQPM